MAKPFRTIKPSAGTPTVSRAKLAEAVRRVAAAATPRGAPAAGLLQQPSVIVATPSAAARRPKPAAGAAR